MNVKRESRKRLKEQIVKLRRSLDLADTRIQLLKDECARHAELADRHKRKLNAIQQVLQVKDIERVTEQRIVLK